MAKYKSGRFVNKKEVVDESALTEPRFGVSTVEVTEVEEESWGSIFSGWIRGIIGFLLLLALLLASLYTGLAATLIAFSPISQTDSYIDRTMVVRGAWADTGGNPPIGTEMVISNTTPAPTDKWWEWITIAWTSIPSPAKVEVVSTQYAELYITGQGEIKERDNGATYTVFEAEVAVVDDPNVSGELIATPSLNFKEYNGTEEVFEFNHVLENAYLVKCIDGYCTPDTYFVVSEEYIYGEVREQ